MIYLPPFLTTKYKTMKKIILTSLLFSLATLVNATPLNITLTPDSIDENLDIGTTIGTATATGGTGPYAYDVQDEGNTYSFGVMLTQVSPNVTDDGVNNFKVRPAGNTNGNNDITIATINFNSSASAENPATKLADAINAYNTANNSGVSATGMNASGTNASGTVRLDSWPANLDGATLIGFSVEADGAYISINSGLTISTPPTSDFFSIGTATGVLKSKVEFDHEAKSTYTIVIRATDNTGGYLENFIITITDDPNDGLTLSPSNVAEHNAVGTTVGILATVGGTGPYTYTVSNANTPNKTFTFTVEEVDIAADDSFHVGVDFIVKAISGTETSIANITFKAGTPHATLVPATALAFGINQFSFKGFAATANTADGTVTLTDWPDGYDGAELIGFSPYDASDGTTLIDHIAIDPDLTLPNYAPFSIKGDKLITTAVLDKATRSSYTITISSTDANNIVVSRDFKITVAPGGTVTGITLAPNTITNQAADGATVGLLSTNATDTGRAYALVDNTATFSISGNKLTANNPNTLQTGTISVSISTLNGDNTIFTQTLAITVTNDPAFSLDVDGNGSFTASNDGLIIFKYLLNSNANNLHTTIANNALDTRNSTSELKAYLDSAESILDVDGNETITASNDGLVIFKYLLNSNANNLHTTIANNALDTRNSTLELKAYLDTYSE